MEAKPITHYFEADHDRLDAVFTRYQQLKRKSFPEAKPYFRTFIKGLKRHIVWEEEVLFPKFEEKTGMKDQGPTAVMRQEHRLIGGFLEEIHNKVRQANPESDEEEKKLLEVLKAHNQKEEQILYPAIDRAVLPEEAAQMFMAMEHIPAERFEACCGEHH